MSEPMDEYDRGPGDPDAHGYGPEYEAWLKSLPPLPDPEPIDF